MSREGGKMNNYGFHVKNGLYFNRDGTDVVIRKFDSGRPNARLMFKVTIDCDSWASICASLSVNGESGETFQKARELFMGQEAPPVDKNNLPD